MLYKILPILLVLVSCHPEKNHVSLSKIIKENTLTTSIGEFEVSKFEPSQLIATSFKDGNNFNVLKRFSDTEVGKCMQCHEAGVKKSSNIPSSHVGIKIKHAGNDIMNCSTCHDSNKPWMLHNLEGPKISMNESFETCMKCHSTQVKDWKMGSHGKRASGWGDIRVVQNCSSCHNPHTPSIEKRFPSINPQSANFKGLSKH
ncbi:MAG: hypothetical protein H6622_00240 [Halobacteriovoraceae bacterium]|nr:hypothetical protein [Halobacteriovoraceae bacterium]